MLRHSQARGYSFGMKSSTAALVVLAAVCVGGMSKPVEAQLRWPESPKRASMRVRLIAVALAVPRSSYFSSHEVFVAETEIGHDEWSLIKLVFTYLPYQPGLLDAGFDYAVVHEISAQRDPDCDETVEQLTARSQPARHEPLVYSRNVPREDLDRRRIPLPCYETNADEYIRSSLEPVAPPPEPTTPSLKERASEPSSAKSIPLMDPSSNGTAKAFVAQPSAPQPIPFLEQPSSAKAIPFFQMPSSNAKATSLGSRPIPALQAPSNARPIPFFEAPLNPRPIPFFEVQSAAKPIPFLEAPSKPQPIPFMEPSSAPKPVLFFDDRSQSRPTTSRKKRASAKPAPAHKQRSNP
jgi:hypothetical protein